MPLVESDRRSPIVTLGDCRRVTTDDRPSVTADTCCPRSVADQRCRLFISHRRRRQTGPEHPLTVVECTTHGGCFTLYPPGYAPYLRQPVLLLSPDGREVVREPVDCEQASEWRGTLFEAAVDAKAGCAWWLTSENTAADHRWHGTQGRHLHRSASLLGVACELGDRVREAISACLSVGTLVLRELSTAQGYRAIGGAVCNVLQRVRGGVRRALQLLVCGHLVGHWGAPWRWDPVRQVVERSPFLGGGTTVDNWSGGRRRAPTRLGPRQRKSRLPTCRASRSTAPSHLSKRCSASSPCPRRAEG